MEVQVTRKKDELDQVVNMGDDLKNQTNIVRSLGTKDKT